MNEPKLLHQGRFLELVQEDRWEYARRSNASAVVCVMAITEEGNVLFVEQFRPPVNASVIELPAGLVGDEPDGADEELKTAALRELQEETGYETDGLEEIGTYSSSAGLTNEVVTMFLALNCRKTGSGGGVGGESIQIHEIPENEAADWLVNCIKSGKLMDAKVWAGLSFYQHHHA